MAEIRPLLLVIEDVHWSDPSTFDWLDHIITRIHNRRLLVVLTARPELTPRWNAEPCYREHRLRALPEADARALAHDLATRLGAVPPADLVDELVERSGGVPLYLEELLRFVLTVEAPARSSARRQIPATLRDTLVASLDRLSVEARLVAQIGAVFERDFRDQLVERLAGDAVVDADSALGEFEDAGVIMRKARRHDSQLLFRHALVQEAAYQSLAPAERRACHGRVADLLRSERSKGADMPAELLAAHYEAACRVAEALDCWEEAGAAALRKWALREAVDHLRRPASRAPTAWSSRAAPMAGSPPPASRPMAITGSRWPLRSPRWCRRPEPDRRRRQRRDLVPGFAAALTQLGRRSRPADPVRLHRRLRPACESTKLRCSASAAHPSHHRPRIAPSPLTQQQAPRGIIRRPAWRLRAAGAGPSKHGSASAARPFLQPPRIASTAPTGAGGTSGERLPA